MTEFILKIKNLKFNSNLPEANELKVEIMLKVKDGAIIEA